MHTDTSLWRGEDLEDGKNWGVNELEQKKEQGKEGRKGMGDMDQIPLVLLLHQTDSTHWGMAL